MRARRGDSASAIRRDLKRRALRAIENPRAEITIKKKRAYTEVVTRVPREACVGLTVDRSEQIVRSDVPDVCVGENTFVQAEPVAEKVEKIWRHILVNHVRKRCPGVLGVSQIKHLLFYGKVQSGKGTLQFLMMWHYSFVLKKKVVHLLDNRCASLKQNVERDYARLCDIVREACAACDVGDWQNYVFTYFSANEKNPVPRDEHNVSVSIGNPTRIRQLCAQVERETGIVIVVDESDVFVKSPDAQTKTEKQFERLKKHADHLVMFTATPFANYAQKDTQITLYVMQEDASYRDIENDKIEKRVLAPDFFAQREKFKNIKELLRTEIFPHDFGHLQNITLVNVESQTAHMNTLASLLKRSFGDTFHCVVQHSNTDVTFKGQTFKSEDLRGLFQAIEENTDGKPIVIISGQMAGRAVTYRSQTGGISQLTSMIYHPSATQHETGLQQAQRICGNYGEHIPNLLFFATQSTIDTIRGSLRNTQVQNNTIEENVNTLDCITHGVYENTGRSFDRRDVEHHLLRERDNQPEFETLDELRGHYRGEYRFEVCITEFFGRVEVPTFSYTGNTPAEKAVIRASVLQQIRRRHPNLETTRGGVQFCWDDDRYKRVFNTAVRKSDRNYQRSVYALGYPEPGAHTVVPFIMYKPEYHDAANCSEEDTLYVCQTTSGTWRGYVPNGRKRACLRISVK